MEFIIDFWPYLILVFAIVSVGGYGLFSHAVKHTDGTDDIQTADAGQKGLMSSTHHSDLETAKADIDAAEADIDAAEADIDALDLRLDEEHNESGTHKKVTVNDDQDIKFVSGAKIERIGGDLKLTAESGKHIIFGSIFKSSVQPTCKAVRATNYTLATGTDVNLPFNGESWDVGNLHDNSTNPDRITIPVGGGGIYLIGCLIRFESSSTGARLGRVTIDGADAWIENRRDGQTGVGGTEAMTASGLVQVNDNQIIRLCVHQNSGGNLLIYNGSNLTVIKIL